MNDLAASTARYFDGVATAAERAALLKELQGDAQAFAQFREDLRMHLALTSSLQPDNSRAIAGVIADMRPAVPNGATARMVRALRPRVRERSVVRRRTRMRWLAMAAAAGVALCLLLSWPAAPVGTITSLSGSVSMLRGSEPMAVASGSLLRRGDLLTIGAHGLVTWHDADGAELTLATGSARIAATRGGALMLVAGVMHAEVKARSAGSAPYCIATSLGDVQVLGTAFTLRVDALAIRLEVEHGRVRLTRAGTNSAVEVGAGESAAVTPAGLEPPRPLALPQAPPRIPTATMGFQLFQRSALKPSVLAWGQVVADAAAPDGWCLQAVHYGNNLEVYLKNEDTSGVGLFTVPDNAWLTFRCHIDSTGEPLCIYSQNQTTGKAVNAIIRPTTFGSWVSVRVPLSSFHVDGSDEPGIRPGDTLLNLVITANPPTPGRTMCIDDIVCGSSGTNSSAVTP